MRLPLILGLSPKPKHVGPYYADLYVRCVAGAIDLACIYFLFNYAFQAITANVYSHTNVALLANTKSGATYLQIAQSLWESGFVKLWLVNAAFQIILIGVFLIACQVVFGATPGKWTMGLKILRAKTLEPINTWRYILRYISYIPATLFLMMGILWITFNRERRGLHDYIAGTVVIDQRAGGWYWKKIKQGWRYIFKKKPEEAPLVDAPSPPME